MPEPTTPAVTPGAPAGGVAVLRRRAVELLGGAAVGVGLLLLGLAWRGAANAAAPHEQLSFVLSGGLVGLAATGIGCGLLVVQSERRAVLEVARAHQRFAAEWRALSSLVAERPALLRGGPR